MHELIYCEYMKAYYIINSDKVNSTGILIYSSLFAMSITPELEPKNVTIFLWYHIPNLFIQNPLPVNPPPPPPPPPPDVPQYHQD